MKQAPEPIIGLSDSRSIPANLRLLDILRASGRAGEIDGIKQVVERYRFAASEYYLSLADLSDPQDPISAQALPQIAELKSETANPDFLQEADNSPVPGMVRRYPDRALILTTNRCAVHCRHCNRKRRWREAPYDISDSHLENIYAYLESDPQIEEVILSGGDPLILPSSKLTSIIERLAAINSIATLRVHTRLPVVAPDLVTEARVRAMQCSKPVYLAVQFNHPREVNETTTAAIGKIRRAGITVLNQAVLLKGVNDDPAILLELFRCLRKIGVLPYYLFQCDPVDGVSHFIVDLERAVEIVGELSGAAPGYSLPRFAVDLPSTGGKAVISAAPPIASPDHFRITGVDGESYRYPRPKRNAK